MNGIDKPKPIKVFGRSHYACTRCKLSKIKCSGQKPCSNCKSVNKAEACVYPTKDRKIVIMESDLNKLHSRVEELERLLKQGSDILFMPSVAVERQQPKSMTRSNSISPSDAMQGHVNENADDDLFIDYSLESSLLPDFQKESLHWKILNVCNQKLPEKSYALKLIDKVYKTYSSEFYLIDMNELLLLVENIYRLFVDHRERNITFVNQGLYEKVSHVSLCYLFIILAFGEQLFNIVSPSSEAYHSLGKKNIPGIEYYLLASQLFHITREEIDIQFIQSAVLLALYSANLSRCNTVYNYFGVAIRSALAKGYHRQKESACSTAEEKMVEQLIHKEKSKRIFWTVFVIETIWSTYGMKLPVHIEYVDTDVDLPCENSYDLNDNFDSNILEINVHLAKYVAKFVRLIYGPNIRTFSINYINTDQFNQKLLVKNILECVTDLIKNFEQPFLTQYNRENLIKHDSRNFANLLLRYHQLLISITKPLLTVIFNKDSTSIIDNPIEVESAFSRSLYASCSSIDIILKLYETNQLFILGFWDSQHLYSALIMVIISSITGKQYEQLNKGIALLKYMADKNNINAQNCMKKLAQIKRYLERIPEVGFSLDLNSNINSFVRVDPFYQDRMFYNPLIQPHNLSFLQSQRLFSSNIKEFGPATEVALSHMMHPIYESDPFLVDIGRMNDLFRNYDSHSQELLYSMISDIQYWEINRDLTIQHRKIQNSIIDDSI